MTRNIWDQTPEEPEEKPHADLPDAGPLPFEVPEGTFTDEEIDAIDIQIAQLEAEEELTATAKVLLSHLRKARAASRPEG